LVGKQVWSTYFVPGIRRGIDTAIRHIDRQTNSPLLMEWGKQSRKQTNKGIAAIIRAKKTINRTGRIS
jgi:hypothetical protein